MKLESKEVMNAILNNDTGRAAEMLEGFDLLKDGTPPHFTSAGKRLVSTMLGAASVAAWHENLDEDLAHELIERTAMTVNIFQFLQLVMAAAEIKQIDDFSVIPEEIRTALSKNDYTDKIAYAIEKLDDEAFEALIAFIMTGEIERTHVKFNLPIMRHIYAEETIPADLMFAYMGLCPRQTIDEHFSGLHDALGALGGIGLLGALLDGMHDDDDDDGDEDDKSEEDDKKEDHECHCGGCHGGCGGCHGCHSDD